VRALAVASLLLLALGLAGCGRELPSDEPIAAETTQEEDPLGGFEEEALSGRVRADGSSTVAPLMTRAAELFGKEEPEVKIAIGVSGTGGGFERFCAGEIDLANASRPIKDEEKAACEKKGIGWLELQVANDGIAVVVNRENDWATCLTVDQLKTIWEPGSKVDSWNEVDREFPDEQIKLYGAGTDSGTFDYFTDAIVGEEGASRPDYSASEDDNVIVQGVAAQKGGLGYFGLSYLLANQDRIRAVEIDDGDGCVAPTVETVQSGEYKPLSRELFTYPNEDALAEKPAVDAFLTYLLDNEDAIARQSQFVPMTEKQLNEARTALEAGGTAVE
jgi:phosphate transport system substrate-binding protein